MVQGKYFKYSMHFHQPNRDKDLVLFCAVERVHARDAAE